LVRRRAEPAWHRVGRLGERSAREAGRGGAAEEPGHEAAAMNLLQDVSHRALPSPAVLRMGQGAALW
jgi:hypothetical protein